MRACPVCRSAESLTIGRCPLLLVDAGFPAEAEGLPLWEDRGGDLIFAVRVECATCGHLMLFNSQKYRTGDEKIMVLTEEEESQLGE